MNLILLNSFLNQKIHSIDQYLEYLSYPSQNYDLLIHQFIIMHQKVLNYSLINSVKPKIFRQHFFLNLNYYQDFPIPRRYFQECYSLISTLILHFVILHTKIIVIIVIIIIVVIVVIAIINLRAVIVRIILIIIIMAMAINSKNLIFYYE